MKMKPVNLILFTLLRGAILLHGQEGFQDVFNLPSEENTSVQESPFSIPDMSVSGEVGFLQKFYFDQDINSEREAFPYAELNLIVASSSAQAEIDISMMGVDNIVIKTLFLRAFFSFGYLDGGLMKREWGKGDGYHVVDPLNPLDQTGGVKEDLNEMKQSEIMLIWNQYLGDTGLLELVYKPFFNPLKTASEGRWQVVGPNPFLTIEPAPDGQSWEFTQFAARLTGSILRLDGGLIYYYGRFPEPGARIDFPSLYTIFTKGQLIGAEAAGVLGPLTIRGELGYWLSEDRAGTVDYLYNDRLCWLGGLDLMLFDSRIFISLQEYGQYVMNYENMGATDVDRNMSYRNQPVTNNLIASLEGRFFKEKMTLRVSGISLLGVWGYILMPELTWLPTDDLELSIKGKIFDGDNLDNNPYYAWRANDSLTLQIGYLF